MKILLTFKTPDALANAIEDIEEQGEIYDKLEEEYFQYGEYATIEITINEFTGNVVEAEVLRRK